MQFRGLFGGCNSPVLAVLPTRRFVEKDWGVPYRAQMKGSFRILIWLKCQDGNQSFAHGYVTQSHRFPWKRSVESQWCLELGAQRDVFKRDLHESYLVNCYLATLHSDFVDLPCLFFFPATKAQVVSVFFVQKRNNSPTKTKHKTPFTHLNTHLSRKHTQPASLRFISLRTTMTSMLAQSEERNQACKAHTTVRVARTLIECTGDAVTIIDVPHSLNPLTFRNSPPRKCRNPRVFCWPWGLF